MRRLLVALLLVPLLAFARLPDPGTPDAPKDPRYCGEPKRDKHGRIKRSQKALRAFVKVFPCPTTLEHTTACPDAAIDHTIPLNKGGCDTPANMTWLPDALKSCAGSVCKDRWEQQYHSFPRQRINLRGKQ